jgi:hypothetical protein
MMAAVSIRRSRPCGAVEIHWVARGRSGRIVEADLDLALDALVGVLERIEAQRKLAGRVAS